MNHKTDDNTIRYEDLVHELSERSLKLITNNDNMPYEFRNAAACEFGWRMAISGNGSTGGHVQ